MFIHGMKIAAASPTVPSLPIALAKPDAMPPFCSPTSNAMKRAEFLSRPAPRSVV